jgi:hypothetical protein
VALLQALIALIGRSAGTILSSLFGWAVLALFGQTSSREKIWLSSLVGAAAAWPLLVMGAIWPRLATVMLTFVPLPEGVPSRVIRLIWIGLATAVPFALGLAIAVRSRGAAPPIPGTTPIAGSSALRKEAVRNSPLQESWIVRLLRGIPITMAVAASFFIVFVTVPLRRVAAILRRQVVVDVPLVTDARSYDLVAQEVSRTLGRHGIEVRPAVPGWSVTAPSRILMRLGGPSFRDYVPQRLACFRGPRLEILLYANGLSLRGSERETTWAHGLVVEALTDAPAYQTFDPIAQDIERQIRSVWAVFRQNPGAHVEAPRLRARLDEIAQAIRDLPVSYEEWQIVYRQALQLDRALRGVPQLLEAVAGTPETASDSQQEAATMRNEANEHAARALSLRELITGITTKVALLAKKEVELAKMEAKADLESELSMVKGLAVAVVVALLGLNALLVALILKLATFMEGWLAAVLVGGGLLMIGVVVGYVSWGRRVTDPLAITRKTLKEDAQWAKERLA